VVVQLSAVTTDTSDTSDISDTHQQPTHGKMKNQF